MFRSLMRSVCLAALATVSVYNVAPAAPAAPQPNIVLILADDVGREVLGCYGGTSYRTPRIDQLADQGMRFEHAYVMPVCHPSRIALMTGRYPLHVGDPEWGSFPTDAESQTIAQALKRQGYETAIAGKWQFSVMPDNLDHPGRMGFDRYCLFAEHEGPRYYFPRVFEDGRERDDVHDRYGPDVYADYMVEFIKQRRDRPFFAYYSMALCHAETNDMATPPPFGPLGRYQTYAEMVPLMDKNVGRIVDAVDGLDSSRSTIILFIGDNGTAARNVVDAKDGEYIYEQVTSNWRGRQVAGGKGSFTDWGIRVPLLVRWPKIVKADQVVDDMVDATDFLPTFVELAGGAVPGNPPLDGHSFVRLLTAGEPTKRQWIYASHRDEWCVRDRNYKLHNDGRFFDVENDVDELDPLDRAALSAEAATAWEKLSQVASQLQQGEE